MAASALVTGSIKVTGVASLASLAGTSYELSSRFTGVVPTDVDAAQGVSAVGWVAIPAVIGGAESGIFIKALTEDLEVSLGTTVDSLDFTIPEGEFAYVPFPAGAIKVKWTAGGGIEGTYSYVVFGASA